MYLCKGYMASTLQKLVIPIFGYCNLLIPWSTTTSQPYKVVTTVQGCEHLAQIATILSQPY